MLLKKNEIIDGKLHLAGAGSRSASSVFVVTLQANEEEISDTRNVGTYTAPKYIAKTPKAWDSSVGNAVSTLMQQAGIDMKKVFKTPIVRYLFDDGQKLKKVHIDEQIKYTIADIEDVKPLVILCMGKPVLEALFPEYRRFSASDLCGTWLYSERFRACVYVTVKETAVYNPTSYERMLHDFQSVAESLALFGSSRPEPIPVRSRTVHDSIELRKLIDDLRKDEAKILSVDCEWHGIHHVDGKLRSLQIAWSESDAAYIRFMDDRLNYAFDVDYKTAGGILAEWLNRPDVKYIGHHISADLPWMHYWLGLDYLGKAIFDTEFAMQCINEEADLGLEQVALKYTTFGRYDFPLIAWKKDNPKSMYEDGYGRVPDDILIPYGILDVLTPFRAYPKLRELLANEGDHLVRYYDTIFNPLVTDVFTWLCVKGMPVDMAKVRDMQDIYNWAREETQKEFTKLMVADANRRIMEAMSKLGADDFTIAKFMMAARGGHISDAESILRSVCGSASVWGDMEPMFAHFIAAPTFNNNSKPQMVRWLFDVCKYEPVKSTPLRQLGIPAMAWDRVLSKPEAERSKYTPATDKDTLEILNYRHSDPVLAKLLELNAIRNICKSFLPPTKVIDEASGETADGGLITYITSDNRLVPNQSATETGRPRSWSPNLLNLPSWIQGHLADGLSNIVKQRHEEGTLPERFNKYVGVKGKNFPTIRGIVMARPGWCVVEADLKTAEMFGQGYIFGDQKLIDLLEKPDKHFAFIDPAYVPEGIDPADCQVRLSFPDFITAPDDKEKFIMAFAEGGVVHATFTEDQLLRNDKGEIVHPGGTDLHWNVVELSRHCCREMLNKKKDRGAGKVTNFCIVGDTPILTDTGYKAIADIKTSDLVWDGIEFVQHKGIINHGKHTTISYKGLRATPDHLVWTDRGVTTLLDAAIRGRLLIETAKDGKAIKVEGLHRGFPVGYKSKQRLEARGVCESKLPSLWKGLLEEYRQFRAKASATPAVSGEQEIHDDASKCYETLMTALQLHDVPTLLWIVQTIIRLQSYGYKSSVLVKGGLYQLSLTHISERLPDTQRCPLYEGQSFSVIRDLLTLLQKESEVLESSVQDFVYDIIDAGERHRFTANNFLVSNSSAYGGQSRSLQRKIEVVTGEKFDLEDIDAMLEAIQQRAPEASAKMKELENTPLLSGRLVAKSGRVRHCHLFGAAGKFLTERTKESYFMAIGRECRNYFLQESVASCAAIALKRMIDFGVRNNLEGYVFICLYDSIVVHCPEHEREVWAKALELYMHASNGWAYEGRILRYKIDLEYNAGWSLAPSEEKAAQLKDPTYMPTPEKLTPVVEWLDSMILMYDTDPSLSVINTDDLPEYYETNGMVNPFH